MGDIQQSPCLWTGLYHCFRCLTLYFLTLSTDPMCPPEQKDLFIGSSWQWISSESNKYQPKYILKLENHPKKKSDSSNSHYPCLQKLLPKKRIRNLKHVVWKRIWNTWPSFVKKHLSPMHIRAVWNKKNSPSQHSVWAFRFNQFHKKWLVVIYRY